MNPAEKRQPGQRGGRPLPGRRQAIIRLACGAAVGSRIATSHGHAALGPVTPPRAAPSLGVLLHTGERHALHELLRGRCTALQLMFTGCSAVCPLQGAVFAAVDKRLAAESGATPELRLLSISIDPLSDDAAALNTWRRRFGASPRWTAAAPAPALAERMPEFLNGKRAGADRHSAHTYLFDRQARLAYRCAELASAADITEALRALARGA